jgi:two-component sensor histidine kinase
MSNTIHQQYKETLEAISLLQDRLYNARDRDGESQQEQLICQANALIQEACNISEGKREASRQTTALHAERHKSAELAVSLQFVRSDLRSFQTRLQTETINHQQTQTHLNTVSTHLHEEIARHQQTEMHVKQLEHLLQQEIAGHERAKAQVGEHEILLREIHHRVKNNMTMAISLIQVQMGKIHAEEDRVLFQELEHRIYTMALIHENLYQSQHASSINLRLFVADLSQRLLSSYLLQPNQIALELAVDDVYVPLDKAIPCGLILNELLTNALKYAFPDGRQGTIAVIGQQQPTSYVLTIRDDGIGLPEDFDSDAVSTLGMRLVTLLAQTMGTLRIDRTRGTAFIIDISMDVMDTNED